MGIITVSKALERKIKREYGYKNVTTIYNPIEKKDDILHLDLDYQFIFGMGRMKTNIKQFDHLIKAYKKSLEIKPDNEYAIKALSELE